MYFDAIFQGIFGAITEAILYLAFVLPFLNFFS